MRVIIWPAGGENDGTSQYRLYMPACALLNEGAPIAIDRRGPIVLWNREWHGDQPPPDVRAMGLAQRPDADVVVIQRPGRRWWADIIPMLQKLGIKVVVDVDDLFDSIDHGNFAKAEFDPAKSGHHNHQWVALACERADRVTCTTEALCGRYGYGHGLVLPNLVPERYFSVDAGTRIGTVGWTGHVGTHPKDLQVTNGAVGRTLDENAWRFHVVGDGKGVKNALGLSMEPSTTGWVSFDEYAHAMAEIAVGIVPLADTAFNRAKSSLKMSEFAALGVPVLASPTPDNLRMKNLGVGAIVKHPHHWGRALGQMLRNKDYRENVAGKSKVIMANHTYEKQCWRWAQAWGLEGQ